MCLGTCSSRSAVWRVARQALGATNEAQLAEAVEIILILSQQVAAHDAGLRTGRTWRFAEPESSLDLLADFAFLGFAKRSALPVQRAPYITPTTTVPTHAETQP